MRNEVYTTEWFESRPANPVTIADFEDFCRTKGIRITRRAHLARRLEDALRRCCPISSPATRSTIWRAEPERRLEPLAP